MIVLCISLYLKNVPYISLRIMLVPCISLYLKFVRSSMNSKLVLCLLLCLKPYFKVATKLFRERNNIVSLRHNRTSSLTIYKVMKAIAIYINV